MAVVRVYVSPKQGILDPQGKAVGRALQALGFVEVTGVRVGKYLEIQLAESASPDLGKRVKEMCERLLANPVIEDYRVDVE